MTASKAKKATGYDRYVNYKMLAIAVAAFVLVLVLPIPKSMLDVGVEYALGQEYVLNYYSQQLFSKDLADAEQWQAMTAQILERNMRLGAMSRARVLKRDAKWIEKEGIPCTERYVAQFKERIEQIPETEFLAMMTGASELRHQKLTYESLPEKDQAKAYATAKKIKIVTAMLVFVIVCFLTEAMPMPGVAFCIGLILVFSGIVSRTNVASLFWSDAVWFIMGSLMFAAAFVKTGVDKRVCLVLFRYLAKPHVTLICGHPDPGDLARGSVHLRPRAGGDVFADRHDPVYQQHVAEGAQRPGAGQDARADDRDGVQHRRLRRPPRAARAT